MFGLVDFVDSITFVRFSMVGGKSGHALVMVVVVSTHQFFAASCKSVPFLAMSFLGVLLDDSVTLPVERPDGAASRRLAILPFSIKSETLRVSFTWINA